MVSEVKQCTSLLRVWHNTTSEYQYTYQISCIQYTTLYIDIFPLKLNQLCHCVGMWLLMLNTYIFVFDTSTNNFHFDTFNQVSPFSFTLVFIFNTRWDFSGQLPWQLFYNLVLKAPLCDKSSTTNSSSNSIVICMYQTIIWYKYHHI